MARRALSFLTWNLAGLERSDQAPPWWEQHHTEAAVREVILAAEPAVVALQELPGLVPYVETHTMVPANPTSHGGHLATLVANEVVADGPEPAVTTVAGCGVLVTFDDPPLTVANVHLAPGPAGAGSGWSSSQPWWRPARPRPCS